MFFRHLMRRGAQPCWRAAARGKKDLPIRQIPSVSDFFQRPRFMDDAWFRDVWGPRNMDDFMRENIRRMDAMFRMSPFRTLEGSEARGYGQSADIVEASFGKEGLNLEMNLSHFAPDDIAVKFSGNRLVISGKHSSKPDEHGFVAREFTRKFLIPEEIDSESLSCRLTDEGHLVVTAKVKGEPENSRTINIEREPSNKEAGDQTKEEKE
ncbi:hypothetical protein ACOMHN_017857 [Nucella lapillus]